ncbi:PREDICTED: structure-specific endonuclease subunit SLX4 isoform X1 [Lepidothrix coronata]|uniref:Structure-specific endonuclease subunit SLX4 n=1 Tax=Lepidothrix coronata TaxID=321398 RepID=A0A6J0GRI5_9PASS|nr:PREDICTED: structure-specific endonuclease subunit SLX4 isoform X1 [Lepidothrix coronata]XP_017664516.1 PREDICTED: structure-specific endonuclease subunit SLX4 isoform X1 [Lepidothrix coronata]XP_017664517.1 PREDICTED: structure-specific endonuclease subunit SLX4 isoform X1 [Lepidothrix coronata]XP_017664518.1 PREDICTED: structure-specific endonuclease subunit SLX4 isoform X1 [Lepidothrix coronata]XP_017664519.1 PREDICTED: structure-specific endonuclease subunit SLX4 isoform X1 [Lepidothrix 
MDEQDSDFKELWANILNRAKKKAGDAETAKRAQNRSKSSTTARSKLRRGKAAAQSQTHPHLPAVKETNLPRDSGPQEQTLVPKEEGDAAACGGETAQGDGGRSPFPASQLSTGTSECSQRPLTVNTPSGCSQTTLPFLPATQPGTCSSPTSKVQLLAGPKVRVAELVVERMQQFKRVAPEQLKLSTDGSVPRAAASGDFPDGSQEQNPPEDDTHQLPSVEHDGALALALQQESKEEAMASLEDAGLFFCQICQKDLSAMNTTRREQHVNRCLDEMEEAQMSSSSKPVVPECPICGKQFQTPQSRVSHLKRCAVEMDVPPNLLLQAVQLQVATLGDAPLHCPSNQPSRAKRKGSSNEDSKKTQKRAKMEPKDEDLQVAMAMSRSLLEQEKQEQARSVTNVKPVAAFPIKWKPGSEKKRRKRGPAAPPPLLLQDPEKARRRIQERVAMLLAEEVEFPPTPQLPISKILEGESGKAAWLLPLSKAKECFLWKISALTGPCDPESFYTAALTPPIVPWKPVQNDKPENLVPSVGCHQPEVSQQIQPHPSSQELTCTETGGQTSDESKPGPEGDGQFLSPSQKDVQTLQDLVELAREGLTLTQWNLDVGHVQAAEQPGEELSPSDPPQSGFVPPSKERSLLRSSSKRSSLRLLAEDFGAMVNNPHLSDVQFQVDSGEVLYAHLFVLYARCPPAAQAVHSQGFVVEEDGAAPTRRVLLSDVTAEAAGAFLRYLYAADTHVPAGLRPQLGALAARFGVRELMAECENNTGESQVSSGVDSEDDLLSVRDDKDCEDRAENFQDLLNSVWVGEDEEEEAMLTPECQKEDDSGVSEQDLEEIYEFAATQRKMAKGEGEVSEGTDCSICSDTETAQGTDQPPEGEEAKRPESASVSNSFKDPRDGNDVERSKCDSSAQEEKIQPINRCKSMNHPQTATVPHHSEPQKWDGASHGANEGEAVSGCEGVEDSKSSRVSHDEADHCEEQLPGSQGATDVNGGCEPLFSASQGDHWEPSPMKEVTKESGKSPNEKHVDLNDSFLFSKSQKDHSPCRNGFCGSPAPKPYMPLFPAVGSSPASPKSEGKFARDHVSTPKQNKKEKSFPCDEIHSQKAKELDAALRNENIVSPAELPHSDLNKHTHVPVLSSPGRTQDAAAQGNKEGDVIVLSSDDEMELQQDKKSPESIPALKEMEIPGQLKCTEIEQGPEVPKPEHTSSVPETEQRSAQVSCGSTDSVHVSKDVEVSPELPLSRQTGACTESKRSPNPSPEKRLSHEMSSGTDSSWLVPGTPVLSKNRSFSTQTHVTSINSLKSPRSKLSTKKLAAGSSNHELTGNLKKVHETTLSDKDLPVESSATERSVSSSPAAGSLSKSSPPVLPVDPVLLSPGHTNTKSKCANVSGLSKPPCHEQPLEDGPNISVVEVEDGEREVSLPSLGSSVLLCEEPPLPTDDCWHVEYLSPVRGDSQDSGQVSCAKISTVSSPSPGSWQDQWESPVHTQGIKGSTPLQGSPAGRRTTLLCPEKSPIEASSSLGSRPSYLNSKIWDDWNGEEKEDEFPEVLPLSQRLAAAAGACQIDPVKTPEPSCQEHSRSPSTPVTPMPAYSIMETPQLKKELSRFGVRALPKRQMVLKLKEIFQYTHRDGDSDFEDDIPYSQPLPQESPARRPRQPKAGRAGGGKGAGASKAGGKRKQVVTASSGLPVDKADDGSYGKGCAAPKGRTKVTPHPEGAKEQEKPSVFSGPLAADGEEPALSASQESAASSGDGSSISFGSQSSFVNGFEACAFASEEEEEEFPASQAAAREEEKLEAVRCYIRSNTALYNRILFYEPLELVDLHAELKQNGIKISKAKLLDFLDSQCITCTMAGARKEQGQKRKENKKQRRRRQVKATPPP